MQQRGYRNRIGLKGDDRVLVTETAVLTETDAADALNSSDGDVIHGLRAGLAISAILWLGMIFLGHLIFG